MALAYGTVQRRATLDHVIARLAGRSVRRLEPPVLAALRLGLLQLLFLDGMAEHAAVHESVELAKAAGARGGAGLVNAVLRRATREGRALLAELSDDDPGAGRGHALGPGVAGRAVVRRARVRDRRGRCWPRSTSRPSRPCGSTRWSPPGGGGRRAAGGAPGRWPSCPRGSCSRAPLTCTAPSCGAAGAIMAQSRASMLARPGAATRRRVQRVLDLCAAPGRQDQPAGRAERERGGLVAVERHPGRARAPDRDARAHARDRGVGSQVADAAQPRRPGEQLRRRAGRPAVQRAGHAPVAARSALAHEPGADRRAGSSSRPDPPRRRAGHRPGRARSSTRSARSPGPRANDVVDAFLAERADFAAEELGSLLPSGRRRPATCRRCPTGTAPTASSSLAYDAPVSGAP